MYQDGAPGILSYPHAQASVLASIAAASGVTPPVTLSATIVAMSPANTTIQLIQPNAGRTFLLIYNPTWAIAQLSLGRATQGGRGNLSIGPGQAYFQADAQGLGATYKGAMTAIGLLAPQPLWVWEDGAGFYNDGGQLAVLSVPDGYPTSPVGLPIGSIYSNGLAIAVVPGFVPNPAAARIFFGQITTQDLLATGGGNLPLTDPQRANQLWNDSGTVAISLASS